MLPAVRDASATASVINAVTLGVLSETITA